jgi:hypothetical protein
MAGTLDEVALEARSPVTGFNNIQNMKKATAVVKIMNEIVVRTRSDQYGHLLLQAAVMCQDHKTSPRTRTAFLCVLGRRCILGLYVPLNLQNYSMKYGLN